MVGKRSRVPYLVTFFLFIAVALGGLYVAFDNAVAPIADEAAAQVDAVPQTRVVGGVEYPVNTNSMTFGRSGDVLDEYINALDKSDGNLTDEEALALFPDYVSVWASDGNLGYITGEDYYRFLTSMTKVTGVLQPDGSVVPSSNLSGFVCTLYDADGVTVIGEWRGSGSDSNAWYSGNN